MIVNYRSSSSDEEPDNSSENDSSPPRKRGKATETSTSEPLDYGSAKRTEDKSTNKTPRLPLPESMKEMFREPEEQWTDNTEEHGGRLGSFQHERGNWVTYVFFPYKPEESFVELLIAFMVVTAAYGSPLIPSEEFHVSLSKTVVLRHHWIQPFIQSIWTSLTQFQKSVISNQTSLFFCMADKLRVYFNAEKTRTFLGMEISTGTIQLLELIKLVDQTMKEFNLSTFYKDPSFHVSLAWCVGDHTERLKSACLSELQGLVDSHEDGPFYIRLNCKELRCKSGNKVFLFPQQ
ncbi:U6 snRNA phosphodiesterase 1-like [Myxocyprinus asiaticus]|uniref:U6 snRNA phosphodiesterase 1-like n=1 Tax=Myxocyprinus asiaticus TaxID=70543 RepID=UPI002222B7A0|nr:U6 snRNA phosphodiesterase 1-like [Myxocyprinus asiaticus]